VQTILVGKNLTGTLPIFTATAEIKSAKFKITTRFDTMRQHVRDVKLTMLIVAEKIMVLILKAVVV